MMNASWVTHVMIARVTTTLFLSQMAMLIGSMSTKLEVMEEQKRLDLRTKHQQQQRRGKGEIAKELI
jgi:hypothetical protein